MAKNSEPIVNKVLHVGNATMNTISLAGMTEKEFISTFTGKLTINIKDALKIVRKYLKKAK
jgi:hypothetical protein